MKGQMSVEAILLVLAVVASIGVFFVFMMRINTQTITGTESVMIYPENPPQIISISCYTSYGHAAVAEDVNGTVYYRVKTFDGTEVADSSLTVSISEFGILNFTAAMEDGIYYSVRFFTPDWSITETCTP